MSTQENDTTNAQLLLSELVDQTAEGMVREGGLDKVAADKIARNVAQALLKRWAGQQVYFSRRLLILVSERDMEIYHKHDGTTESVHQLAREYEVSEAWIYTIIKTVHANEIKKRQGDMFPE